MSLQADAELVANVQVSGTDASAQYYDQVTHLWRTKNQAGVDAPLVSGASTVSNADGTLTISPTSGAVVASLAAAYKSKIDNWFNVVQYNVLDNGISTANSAATNLAAWNALATAAADNATILFPPSPSAFQFSGALAIPAGKHFRIMGSGPEKTIIQTTSATADIFQVGDWYNEFWDLKFTSSVTRTAGAAINSGNNVAVNVFDCDFSAMFNGIVFTGGANAGNLALVRNCHFTNTVNFSIQLDGQNANTFITECTADCSPATAVHLEVNQCGSLLISNCDFIRATNNMRLNPDSGTKGVFSVYCNQVFFDTAAGSSVKFQGGAAGTNIQRVKFVSCWFSGSVTGCEFAAATSTNKATAIDFVACDIYSNSANGVLSTEVQDFSMSNCRIAGNATAGVNIVATAGSVTKFDIQNCTIGPTAGVGANGIGVNVQAGAYGGYIITGNNVAGNTSNNNILDLGTVATTDLKQVIDNAGHLTQGQIASNTANTATSGVGDTALLSARIPANAVIVGQVFKVSLYGNSSSTGTLAVKLHVGAAGTIADTALWTPATSAAQVANHRACIEVLVTVKSIGATGTVSGNGVARFSNVFVEEAAIAAPATVTINTQNPWFITASCACSVGTFTVIDAVIEAL